MVRSSERRRVVLVVDDDPHILELLEARLSAADYRVITAREAQEALQRLEADGVDLLITDIRMPGMGGMELLREARRHSPDLPVILLTAYGTIPDAVRAIKEGAVEYLTKPFDGKALLQKVEEILKKLPAPPAARAPSTLTQELWGGSSDAMKGLYDLMERVIPSDVNVLILGESGAGKELVARLLHSKGPRKDHPFVVVDCGSTPTGLLESELFGHVRGAFTHAFRDRKGLMEAADGGTLFLDEIGNISSDMQVRLLRFLEERRIRRIGDLREIPVDCRVISATHVDLPREVEAGRFREDLYYRLRVVTLRVPPLRERKEEISLLAQRFAETFCARQGLTPVTLPPETLEWLGQYPWPGNVRELKNAVEAGVTLSRDGILRIRELHLAGVPKRAAQPRTEGAPLSLEGSEKALILRALERTGWVQKDAARLLGISRRVLHYKIRKFEIEFPGRRSTSGPNPRAGKTHEMS
jgi:DNA-binding NtrC family response regulator